MASGDIDQTQIWETYQTADRAEAEPALVVDVDGFEGPLDLLLSLARSQKDDLARISILALAEQYLAYIEQIRQLRLELAADYLVMAAWLAYLKSRLLLPEEKGDDEPTGEELANALAFRLRRLEAMRDAAARLAYSDRLERDVFGRGFPEPIVINKKNEYSATIYDLLSAYAAQRQQKAISIVQVKARKVWSLQDARAILVRMIGSIAEWTPIDVFLSPFLVTDDMRATITASSFSASLELVKEGKIDLRQTEPFAPLYMRDRKTVVPVTTEAGNG
jgi:segregation and condensation protein A